MEYSSRIHVKFRNSRDIERLSDIDISRYGIEIGSDAIFKKGNNDIIIDGGWSVSENDLEDLVNEIVERVPEDCIVISDTLSLDEESVYFYACYFGESIFADNVDDSYNIMFSDGDIVDFVDWVDFLESIGVCISDIERNYLKEFDVIC